jgi:hypothetical protein
MQLKPKSVDSSKNMLDIKKSRNANELVVILGRINTALRLRQQQFRSRQELSKQYDVLRWTIQSTEELDCARQTASSFSDGKRERVMKAIKTLQVDVLALRKRALASVDKKCKPMVSEKMNTFVDHVHDLLSPVSNRIMEWHCYDNDTVTVVLSVLDLESNNDFVLPRVFIKLDEVANSDAIRISSPSEAYVTSATTYVANKAELKDYLENEFNYTSKKLEKVKAYSILHMPGVTGVDVKDSLIVHLTPNVSVAEVHSIVGAVLPIIRRAYVTGEFEILYRTIGEREGLEFLIAKREVRDKKYVSRLSSTLGLSRAQAKTLQSMRK